MSATSKSVSAWATRKKRKRGDGNLPDLTKNELFTPREKFWLRDMTLPSASEPNMTVWLEVIKYLRTLLEIRNEQKENCLVVSRVHNASCIDASYAPDIPDREFDFLYELIQDKTAGADCPEAWEVTPIAMEMNVVMWDEFNEKHGYGNKPQVKRLRSRKVRIPRYKARDLSTLASRVLNEGLGGSH